MGAFCSPQAFVNKEEKVIVFGSKVIPFHKKMKGENVVVFSENLYVDGYAWKDKKWKRTFFAFLHQTLNRKK